VNERDANGQQLGPSAADEIDVAYNDERCPELRA
jgi:hypothetical protein